MKRSIDSLIKQIEDRTKETYFINEETNNLYYDYMNTGTVNFRINIETTEEAIFAYLTGVITGINIQIKYHKEYGNKTILEKILKDKED